MSFSMNAQDEIFEKVSVSQIQSGPLEYEKGAEGTVLSDLTRAEVIYAGGFKIKYTRTVRLKIFKPSGYYLANVQIPYGSKDKVTNLKASVFNLVDSSVERVDIARKSMFLEKVDRYHNVIRFTFPNVREGSVIQYSYTIIQNEVWNYHSAKLQREIPVRFAKYDFSHPDYLNYVIHYNQDSLIQFIRTSKKGYFNGNPVKFKEYSWIGTNLDVFQKEPLMPEGEQYELGVDFALVSVNLSDGRSLIESPSYESLTEELIFHNPIGQQLNNNLLFSGQVKKVTQGLKDDLSKMTALYTYVQKEMKWNGYEQMWPSRSLLKPRNEKTGTNAEINLILINMLRTAGIPADPVILSTRQYGEVNQLVATTGRLNYLVALATINNQTYLMDASDKYNPAGNLPFKCLNGYGWILNPQLNRWIPLLSNERFFVSEAYDLILDENKMLSGKAMIKFDGFDAAKMRRLIYEEGISGFLNAISSIEEIESVKDIKFINLDSLQLPLELYFNVRFNYVIESAQDLTFFKAILSIFGSYMNSWIDNKRLFPVDMGCGLSNIYYCRIQLPDGFHVEEMPPATRIRMPENEGTFMFSTGIDKNWIVSVSDLKIRKHYYETNEYQSLKEFFDQINQKCSELVIIHKNFQ